MLSEYAGWQISDDKQREIEAQIAKKQLLAALRMESIATQNGQAGWLRVQLHHLGVRMERFGERMQLQCEQCREALAEEQRLEPALERVVANNR